MLSDKQENVTALVKDCWTATRNNSYATCGPQSMSDMPFFVPFWIRLKFKERYVC